MCSMRLVTNEELEMAVVVHIDYISSVGKQDRCEQLGKMLNEFFHVKFLGELRMNAGIRFFS